MRTMRTTRDAIHFQGSYRYGSREELERAIAEARLALDDEDLTDSAATSLRSFASRGNEVVVDITVPGGPDVRFAAAAMFQALAVQAITGVVEARRGATALDVFPCGVDD
ncbi:MAG: hypothetical protein KF773_10305 [Deltaproteobacteria bacterium]|nr:hypothetical protein [Deltaproteobacteria bacterium]MCW5804678.1 hypothetical protein [Deltaproteobacteria bacterium]